jgi:hypothetical protein
MLGVGGEGGEPVPVDVGEPQLRPGMGPLLADDDPHPGRPGRQVHQAGDIRDPGPVPDLPAAVVGGCPGVRRDLADRLGDGLGDGHADGVVQPPRSGRQPPQELVRAAAGVGADQHPPAQMLRELRDRQAGRLDMVGGDVRPGVPRSEHQGQRFPALPLSTSSLLTRQTETQGSAPGLAAAPGTPTRNSPASG